MTQRLTPEQVADDFQAMVCQRITLVASTATPVNFSAGTRAIRISNFDLINMILVRTDGTAVSGASDANASRVGVSPLTSLPSGKWFPVAGLTTISVYSAGASVIEVEAYS